jgi:hypothetical protein
MSTVRGQISVAFTRSTSGSIELTIALPAGCVASVYVPLPSSFHSGAVLQPVVFVDGKAVRATRSVGGGFAVIDSVGPGGDHTFHLASTPL